VFRAVADQTRRAVLELLADGAEWPVGAMADRLAVSMPLLSRHLGVLRSVELVAERRTGRQRLYRLRPDGLREVHEWTALFQEFWEQRVDNLRAYLARTEQPHDEESS
jgi:DNA-binding transcriptional ArsR family regulator